jgi:hypothetical protein
VSRSPSPVASDSPVATAAEPANATILFEYGQEHSQPPMDNGSWSAWQPSQRQYQRIELTAGPTTSAARAYNDRLARRRAEYVRSWLLDRGVEAEITVRAEGLLLLPRFGTHRSGAPEQPARRSPSRRPAGRHPQPHGSPLK